MTIRPLLLRVIWPVSSVFLGSITAISVIPFFFARVRPVYILTYWQLQKKEATGESASLEIVNMFREF